MASLNPPPLLAYFLYFIFLSTFSSLSLAHQLISVESEKREVGIGFMGRRGLKSFQETPNGGNVTFDCSPSGPCVPCAYSEKNDEKYRCSETGYRIPLKCIKSEVNSKEAASGKSQKGRSALEIAYDGLTPHKTSQEELELSSLKHRSLLDESFTSDDSSQYYIAYRSCIPVDNGERLSVLGFEGIIMGLLLLSGSAIYFRRKGTSATPGVGLVRVPTNSRF